MMNILKLAELIAYAVLSSCDTWTTGLKTGAFLLVSSLFTLMILSCANLCIASSELFAASIGIVFAVIYQVGLIVIAIKGHKNDWISK